MILHKSRRELLVKLAAQAAACAVICLLTTAGFRHEPTARRGADPADISARIRAIAAAGRLPELRWPDFVTLQPEVWRLYGSTGFAPVWLDGDEPTQQANVLVRAFEQSRYKGLKPEDYDATRWGDRRNELRKAATADALAEFDVALTVSAMRYVSDLEYGRIKPTGLSFGSKQGSKRRDLSGFLLERVVRAADPDAAIAAIEPPYEGYRRTEAALEQYLKLAALGDGPPVPGIRKTVAPGNVYAGTQQLARRLELLGDAPAEAPTRPIPDRYAGWLVAGVEHFQARHGLEADGKLGQQTIRALNVPLAARIRQLDDALERWRWLPGSFPNPPIVVNIPEFELRAIGSHHAVALAMKVVVGRAMRTQTPVFAADMRYVVFRPYWNVPWSILQKEILPDIVRNRNYVAANGYEVTDHSGNVVTSGRISDAVLAGLRSRQIEIRQIPGPKNALGLVKFLFPNEHEVYLHDTPATRLFARSRRDFSHGCIRVEKPAELAVWLLRNQRTAQGQPWTMENVRQAMDSGPDDTRISLVVPVPVLILYVTALVGDDGSVHFFDDIYKYDQQLEAQLAQGRPYPRMLVFR